MNNYNQLTTSLLKAYDTIFLILGTRLYGQYTKETIPPS